MEKVLVVEENFRETASTCGKLVFYDKIFRMNGVSEDINDNQAVTQPEISPAALWNAILGEVELEISPQNFATFWKPTSLIDITDNLITIEVNNVFAKTQFEKKFEPLIKEILKKKGFSHAKLEFVTSSRKRKLARDRNESDHVVVIEKKAAEKSATNLNKNYDFANFIVGSNNDMAYAAARAVAENPGQKYNPLFIYGGVGLGKTHLIQAIGNEVAKNSPTKKILYVTTEQFVNDFIYNLRNKSPEEFTKKYRDLDVLIVDDIQFIAGKEKNQEAFFNTFNSLHQMNKQIIIAADRPPAIIPTLTDRLRSRFQMGMVIDVSLPDYETRAAIIQAKSQNSPVRLSHDVIEYLAKNIKTNVRELEGTLNQILAYSEMRDISPTPEFVAELISNTKVNKPKHITARQIVEKTAKYFELKPNDLLSSARDSYIMLPRQIAMYLLRSELHMSYPKIAEQLGRKDHTTAMHSIEKIEKNIKLDITVRDKIAAIREVLYA